MLEPIGAVFGPFSRWARVTAAAGAAIAVIAFFVIAWRRLRQEKRLQKQDLAVLSEIVSCDAEREEQGGKVASDDTGRMDES